jgi:Zn-dependent peptidase ImmA (M78 family)/transcriptional regulator with XRE-family HTH domain
MVRAPINGDALCWARELSQLGKDELGSAAGTTASRIEEFETGAATPTFRQLTLMATKLDRPLGFFFAAVPERPDVPTTVDFRGLGEGPLPSKLVREARRAEQHRDALLDLGVGPAQHGAQLGHITINNFPSRATALRREFGLTDEFVPPSAQSNQVFNFWRGLLEAAGYLVFQTTSIPLGAFRGFSIDHEVLPAIVVNGSDWPNGKTFTLFHEVAHLANRTSGVCILNEDVTEEVVANRFAAAFLMPEAEVRRRMGQAEDAEDAAERLAYAFRVSTLSAAIRLLHLGFIEETDLAAIRQRSDDEWDRIRESQRASEGFVPPWRLRYRDLGSTYIGAIAGALEDGRVDMMDATYLLNARMPTVEKLLEEYHRSGGKE